MIFLYKNLKKLPKMKIYKSIYITFPTIPNILSVAEIVVGWECEIEEEDFNFSAKL